MSKPEINMIVCVAENNLIGDKNPTGNGLLWHSKEELAYYKERTIGNVVIFGKNTAKYVPLELMKKNRDVIVISSKDSFYEIVERYKDTDKKIFICGGATVYKAYLEKYNLKGAFIRDISGTLRYLNEGAWKDDMTDWHSIDELFGF